jgi:hypothetical protein
MEAMEAMEAMAVMKKRICLAIASFHKSMPKQICF